MNKWFYRFAATILAFTMEVRLQALELDQSQCEKGAIKCHLFTKSLQKFSTETYTLRVQPASTIKSTSESSIELVHGRFAVDSKGPLVIKSLYGEVLLNSAKAVIVIDNRWLRLQNLTGEILYRGNGHAAAVPLSAGLEVRFGRVDATGKAKTEFPKLIAKVQFVKDWTSFYEADEYNLVKKDLQKFVDASAGVPSQLSQTYLMSIERAQASLDQQRENERQRREKESAEDEFYRDLFLRKNFMKF